MAAMTPEQRDVVEKYTEYSGHNVVNALRGDISEKEELLERVGAMIGELSRLLDDVRQLPTTPVSELFEKIQSGLSARALLDRIERVLENR